jgi:hypothetical protein
VAFPTQDIGLMSLVFLVKVVNWIKKLSMIQGVTTAGHVSRSGWRQLLPAAEVAADLEGAGEVEETGVPAGRQEMPGVLPEKCQLAGKKQPCQ